MAPPARAGRDGVGPGGGCVTARTVFDTWHKKGSARLPVQSLKNKRQEHVNQPASFRHPKLNRQGRQAGRQRAALSLSQQDWGGQLPPSWNLRELPILLVPSCSSGFCCQGSRRCQAGDR